MEDSAGAVVGGQRHNFDGPAEHRPCAVETVGSCRELKGNGPLVIQRRLFERDGLDDPALGHDLTARKPAQSHFHSALGRVEMPASHAAQDFAWLIERGWPLKLNAKLTHAKLLRPVEQ